MSLPELIEKIDKDMPGWCWLVRSDEKRGYFAHIHRNTNFDDDDYVEGVTSFPVWAETAERALNKSFEASQKIAVN